MKNKYSKTFCPLPFISTSISNNGDIRLCCNSSYQLGTKNKISNVCDDGFSFLNALNSDYFKNVRSKMLQGTRDDYCNACWAVEDAGGVSIRMNHLDSFKITQEEVRLFTDSDGTLKTLNLIFLDLSCGNFCNLKCIMCSPGNSIDLLDEFKMIDPHFKISSRYSSWTEKKDLNTIFPVEILQRCKRIQFLGGEPLINSGYYNFLKYLVDNNLSKNLVLGHISNLTSLPTNIINLWKEFELICLGISIDGYESRNEFIRYPSSWKKFNKNLEKLHSFKTQCNLNIDFHVTFNLLNVFDYHNIITFCTSQELLTTPNRILFFNYISNPEWLDTAILPDKLKRKAQKCIYKTIDILKAQPASDCDTGENNLSMINTLKALEARMMKKHENQKNLWDLFSKNIMIFDKNRENKFKKLYPEISEYINN